MENSAGEAGSQFSRRVVSGANIDTSLWATLDEGALQADKRIQYLARKQAVVLYLSGATSNAIKRATSLCGKQAYRLIRERCLETHPDGRPYGWRGLLPYFRIQPYKRSTCVRLCESDDGLILVKWSRTDM